MPKPISPRIFGFSFAIALASWPQGASSQNQQPPLRVAASSFATVEVHVNAWKIGKNWWEEDAALSGPSRISITYGQPHARGRKVEGGLIPADTVWRFGANMATTLHTDVDFMLGNLKIPRGDYSLFIRNGRAGWQLVINHGTGQWGSDYDGARNLGAVDLASRKLAENEESLSVYLVPESPKPSDGYAELRGILRIKWGQTELTASWRIDQ